MSSRDATDPLTAILADDARREAGPAHLDPDTLVAYHEGALDGNETDQARAHLASCRICSGLLLDLDQPFEPVREDGENGIADFERGAVWRSVQEATDDAHQDPPTHATIKPTGSTWLPWAIAAILLATVAGLGWQVHQLDRSVRSLEGQVTSLETPVADVPILYLDAVTRDAENDAAHVVSAKAAIFVLILTPDEPDAFDHYRVVIAAADDSELTLADLSLSDYGTLRVAVPRRALGAGPYDVTLSGTTIDDRAEATIAHYVLHVAREP